VHDLGKAKKEKDRKEIWNNGLFYTYRCIAVGQQAEMRYTFFDA